MQEKSKLHATAIAYAEAGIPVFPCVVDGKQPATKNGFHDATTDIEQINTWWSEKDYNLAFSPEDAGLFVIDVDPGGDHFLIKDRTYTVRTPRGGWHFYFEGSGKTTASKIAPHVDTRGIGGYVLAPPSVVDGKEYRIESDYAYAPIPEWVSKSLAKVEAPKKSAVEEKDLQVNIDRAKRVLQNYVDKGDVSKEGEGGDDRLYRLACEMLDLGLSRDAAGFLISDIWNPHCQPPWEIDEIAIKVDNAIAFMQNEPGAYGVDDAEKVFGDAARGLNQGEKQKLSRFHFKSESEQEDEPDPTWIIKDLISERSTVMMYGASGSYKSFLALDIALAIATGKESFGSLAKQGLVFYGALEGRAHLKKARRAWRTLKGIEGAIDNFYLGFAPMVGVPGEIQEFGDQIEKCCAGRKPTLIIIDTLSKAMAGLNENDAKDAGIFIKFCDSLVEHFKCAVIAVHHKGKEEGRGARGSSAFFAGFDTVLEVTAHKETKAVAVSVQKHKDAEERDTPWTFEGRLVGPSLVFEATEYEQHKILTGATKTLTSKNVGAALKKLDAFGEDAGITTAVLATELTPARENESIEARSDAIARTSRALTSAAKESLEAYCSKLGKSFIWYLAKP